MVENIISYLNEIETLAIGTLDRILSEMVAKKTIKGYSPNNFEDDTRRGLVDFWVTPKRGGEPIPFSVLDGRRHPSHFIKDNPDLAILKIGDKSDGELKGTIIYRITWYKKEKRMNLGKLLQNLRDRETNW